MGVDPEPKTSPRLLRRSFTVFLAALISIVLAFLAAFALSLYQSGRNNAVSMVAALEQFVGRSLDVSEIVARDALGYLERRGSVEGLSDDRDAHAHFAELADVMRITEGMIFVDSGGTVVLHSGSFPATPVDLSDREWFRAHLDGADHFIDGSFISRVTGTLLFVHTFALRDDEGALLGVVNIGIPSDAILSAQALPMEEEGVVTEVVKESGRIVARDPFPDDLVGVHVARPDALQEGTASLERGENGRLALAAYRRLPDFGLVAAVRIPLSVVLQPLMVTAAVTLPLLALIVIGALATVRRLESQQKQLARGAARLETVLEASNIGAWQWLPKSGRTEYLGRWAGMLGYRTEELEPNEPAWENLLHPDERAHLVDSFARLLRGEKDGFYEEHRMRHKDGHWIWVLDSCRVVERDAEGEPEVVIGIHLDISERRDAEERMRAVSLEVDHRSKNLLAVVQSLVSMTRLDGEETFKATLRGRIQALARAHELLSRSRWKGADLHVIAEEELGPYTAERAGDIEIEGPPTFLSAASIQALAMTLHELATNAAKHGALSVPDGRLRLTWRVLPCRSMFEILWEERTPQVRREDEAKPGFGSRLVRMMIESQLGGTIETDLLDDGFRCRMQVPTALVLRSSTAPSGPPEGGAPPAEGHAVRGGLRILLVEDEAMLAAETSAQLEDAGHVIVASASSLSDATRIAAGADVEAAVLDLNLHGELSFPVADTLHDRGIPFVFVTGYQHENLIPVRFRNAPVVRKPFAADTLHTALARALATQVPDPVEAETAT
jgi:PAS domain S-box-containing protein